jgi:hypothetical protein
MAALTFRVTTALATALPLLLFCEGIGHARTTGPTLGDEIRAEAATEGAPAPDAIPTEALSSWLNVNGIRMCHIPKHPRDGVPANIHACPRAFASRD